MSFDLVILAAGKGSRMKSDLPKVLHKIANLEMIKYPIELGKKIEANSIKVVVNPIISKHTIFSEVETIVQDEQNGTGGAMIYASSYLHSEYTLIICGDSPLIKEQHIKPILSSEADISFVCMKIPESMKNTKYGKVLFFEKTFKNIIEYSDTIDYTINNIVNSGIYKIKTKILKKYLKKLVPNKNTMELYLPDILNMASADGIQVNYTISEEYWPFHGINTKTDLAYAENYMQNELRKKFLENGVTILNPSSVFFSFDTEIDHDVEIEQNVIFKTGVKIMSGAVIKSFSYLEDCCIHNNSEIGPFARIRGNSIIGPSSSIGNFVEIKCSKLGTGVKSKHLAYIGDSNVMNYTNVGAGVVTCNYDGKNKHKTTIGEHSMIGANTSLVAPISIGSNVVIGAGSVITNDVPDDSLSLSRPNQIIKKRHLS